MKFLSNENLLLAYKKAKKSRKYKSEVYLWDLNFEENIFKMKNDLISKKYVHSEYRKIILYDSKKRFIHSPVFRDHILHHMIYSVLYPVFDKKLIDTTYACRKWYWAHKAIKYLSKSCNGLNDSNYYLKLDVSKYFYSINHEKLKNIIFKHIHDEDIRFAVSLVINSYETKNQFDYLFSEDSKYRKNNNKWLPIWSIVSQLFANVYLHKLDDFIKHKLKIKTYLRYMDDFLLIWDKETLSFAKNEIIKFVYDELDLVINPKKCSFNPIKDGIKFVWYRIFNNKIYVWKTTKFKTNKFLDRLKVMDFSYFNDDDKKKINSSLSSRFWTFKHSSFWLNYFSGRDLIK